MKRYKVIGTDAATGAERAETIDAPDEAAARAAAEGMVVESVQAIEPLAYASPPSWDQSAEGNHQTKLELAQRIILWCAAVLFVLVASERQIAAGREVLWLIAALLAAIAAMHIRTRATIRWAGRR